MAAQPVTEMPKKKPKKRHKIGCFVLCLFKLWHVQFFHPFLLYRSSCDQN